MILHGKDLGRSNAEQLLELLTEIDKKVVNLEQIFQSFFENPQTMTRPGVVIADNFNTQIGAAHETLNPPPHLTGVSIEVLLPTLKLLIKKAYDNIFSVENLLNQEDKSEGQNSSVREKVSAIIELLKILEEIQLIVNELNKVPLIMHQLFPGHNSPPVFPVFAEFPQIKEQFGTAAVSYCRVTGFNKLILEALKHSQDLLDILGGKRREEVESLRKNIYQPVPKEFSALTCKATQFLLRIIQGLEKVARNQNNNTLSPGCLNNGGNGLRESVLSIL